MNKHVEKAMEIRNETPMVNNRRYGGKAQC